MYLSPGKSSALLTLLPTLSYFDIDIIVITASELTSTLTKENADNQKTTQQEEIASPAEAPECKPETTQKELDDFMFVKTILLQRKPPVYIQLIAYRIVCKRPLFRHSFRLELSGSFDNLNSLAAAIAKKKQKK